MPALSPFSPFRRRRMIAGIGASSSALLIAGALLVAAHSPPARAAEEHMDHYGPGHWYPTECCSRQDCRPIPDKAVRLTPVGWLVLETEEVIPFGDRKERRSLDGEFHRCSLAYRPNATAKTSNRTICLFVPGQVM